MKRAWFRLAAAGIIVSIATPFLDAQPDRILTPVDRSRVTVLPGGVNPQAQAANDQGPVDPAAQISYAAVYLKPSAAQQAALEQLLREQQQPGSPNFRRFLTPEQFADRFGLSAADAAKVADWLRSEGLQVNAVARGRRWITFSGSAASVGNAFHTSFHRFAAKGETHIANIVAPSIPEALAGVIAGVGGLDDYDLRPAYVRSPIAARRRGPDYTFAGAEHLLAPGDIATIYDIKPLGFDGTGVSIAVIGASDINLQDIRAFQAEFGLPQNDPRLKLTGPDPMTNGTAVEADIDLEWAAAAAPGAQLIYVYARSITTAAEYAVDQAVAPIINMSYGECEPFTTPFFQPIAQQANAEGITWVAPSGDAGAAGCEAQGELPQASKGPAVSIPSSIPEVTGVGGTEFSEGTGNYWGASNNFNGGSALSYIPEAGWNDSLLFGSLSSSGGGASIFFPKPVWQTGPGVPDDGARDVPDIAFSASPAHDAYWVATEGGWAVVGGTSVGSPLFAGVLAVLNEYLTAAGALATPGLGNVNPDLYRLAQTVPNAFHDVTTGNNIVPCAQGAPSCATGSFGYSAGPGYDQVTGLGSIDVYNLAMNWPNSASSSTTLTAAPPSIPFFGGSTQLTAKVTASAGAPSGNVAFLSNNASLGAAPLSGSGMSASATITVDSTQLQLGSNAITAVFGGTANLAGSSGAATVQVANPAGVSAVLPLISPNPVIEESLPSGPIWSYFLQLTNESNVPTTLTTFTIDGSSQGAIKTLFGTSTIPAHGSIYTVLDATDLKPPVNRVFVFGGVDPGGMVWTQQVTVPFVSRLAETPSISLTTPATVPPADTPDSSCQWAQPLLVEERTGFDTRLTSLLINGVSHTSQLQEIFGTTTIAPFGRLQGTLCWSSSTAPGPVNLSLLGTTAEFGTLTAATGSAVLSAGAFGIVTPSVSPSLVSFSGSGSAAIKLSFNGVAPSWTAQISPANPTAGWLTLSPLSGSGAAQLTVTASATGLATGVYNAAVIIQCANCEPQFTTVPVALVAGDSSNIRISGVSNAASGQVAFAPGMLMSVYGTNLAPAAQHAPRIPLPLNMRGVSATVNGVSAPLLDVLPGQLNIQVPYETGAGTAILGVNNNGQVAYFPFEIVPTAPGIFMTGDGMGNLVPFATGKAGDLLSAYITGEGDVTPPVITGSAPYTYLLKYLPAPAMPLSITVGGVPAKTQFIGIPWLVGVEQINFYVPSGVPPGPQPVIVTVGSVSSPPVTLTVTQ